MQNKTKLTDTGKKSQNNVRFCWRLFIVSAAFGILAVIIGVYFSATRQGSWPTSEEQLSLVSLQTKIIFQQHDKNGDGYLSLAEFEPIASRIKDENESLTYSDAIDENDAVLSVYTMFKPLRQETMTKDFDAWFGGKTNSLGGLNQWIKTAQDWKNFGASHFKPFLQGHALEPKLCEPYSIIPTVDTRGDTLSSNRYLPPRLVTGAEILLHRLLAMFHPRPFVYSRFAPQGAQACIRAYNDKYVEVIFRIHAEFQLNVPPDYPFWFTPAQFTGHIIMDKIASEIVDFHMYVPSDKRLNVDMEWLNGPVEAENMEVDIGYMPQMELKSVGPSLSAIHNGEDVRGKYLLEQHKNKKEERLKIKWDEEISFEEAAQKLEIQFYPFKQVEYLNFTDVWPVAKEQQKPVHSILLWGALDDQSC